MLGWLRGYDRRWLRSDLVAGLTSWALVVPQAVAYGQIAGLTPPAGLAAAVAGPLGYAMLGTSRQLMVSPTSSTAAVSAALVGPMSGGDPGRFVALSAALAIVMGAALALLGLLKMGFVSQFLAYSVQVGFMFGLGLTIAVGQLPKVLGIPASPEEGFFPALGYLLANVGQTNPWTAALGLGGLAALLLLSRLAPRRGRRPEPALPGPPPRGHRCPARTPGLAAGIAFRGGQRRALRRHPGGDHHLLPGGRPADEAGFLRAVPRRYRWDARALWETLGRSLSRIFLASLASNTIQGLVAFVGLDPDRRPLRRPAGGGDVADGLRAPVRLLAGGHPRPPGGPLRLPLAVLLTGVLYLGINLLDGNVLTPRLQGTALSVHPVVVLVAVIVAGQLFGLGGVVVTMPILAATSVLSGFFLARLRVRPRAGPVASALASAQEPAESP